MNGNERAEKLEALFDNLREAVRDEMDARNLTLGYLSDFSRAIEERLPVVPGSREAEMVEEAEKLLGELDLSMINSCEWR